MVFTVPMFMAFCLALFMAGRYFEKNDLKIKVVKGQRKEQ